MQGAVGQWPEAGSSLVMRAPRPFTWALTLEVRPFEAEKLDIGSLVPTFFAGELRTPPVSFQNPA